MGFLWMNLAKSVWQIIEGVFASGGTHYSVLQGNKEHGEGVSADPFLHVWEYSIIQWLMTQGRPLTHHNDGCQQMNR